LNYDDVIARLRSMESATNREGMGRFGISTRNTLGISVTALRGIAREIGRDHELALRLWQSGIQEARILAGLIDDPRQVSERQMEAWAADFDSWNVVDGTCGLFARTKLAYAKAFAWSERSEEYVKRAGFVLMAYLAVHDKKASDGTIAKFLPVIEREANDDRNFVRKAVNWALRQIGKRSLALNSAATEAAERIRAQGSRSARWIAADALRELRSEKQLERLRAKEARSAQSLPSRQL
jgi:3-methyladenine DNA glycosylase AlkD